MTEPTRPIRRKTPADASEFEKEQLGFFLSESMDFAVALSKLNPSLAWLRFFIEAKLAKDNGPLAMWIARNFADAEAVREVVDNLYLLGPETAKVLEYHLDRVSVSLPPAMEKAWRLLIKSMRTNTRATELGGWFEIANRIRGGNISPELLTRLTEVLRPTIRLSSATLFPEECNEPIEHPWQLMSIEYEASRDITGTEVLSTWPIDISPKVDAALLFKLTDALRDALEEATYAEIEDLHGHSRSSMNVPSIANHTQNAYETGFLPIIRVVADLWERLGAKSPPDALRTLQGWKGQSHLLIRRLVLFACANEVVPAEDAGQAMLDLPPGDIFLSGATVEVVRLIRARWAEMSIPTRDAILHRICEGPPRDWFRQGVVIDRLIDLARFEILADMERQGLALNAEAEKLLREIRTRWPDWEPQPFQQAGFHSWTESVSAVVHDVTVLDGVADEDLVAVAIRLLAEKGPLHGDSWQGLCLTDPDRATRALRAAAAAGNWHEDFWRRVLWSQTAYSAPETVQSLATLLRSFPDDKFSRIAPAAAWWLTKHVQVLADDSLWPVWDRIAGSYSSESDDAANGEALNMAMNSPTGQLGEILLQRLASETQGAVSAVELLRRLDVLICAPGRPGFLARVYLAANVHPLFERIPDWTRDKIVPVFAWTHPDAPHAWAARKYASHIGSPVLFHLTKQPLLELFGRSDVGSDEIRTFSQWLVAVLIANRRHSATYPLTEAEVRTALRRGGEKALPGVVRRLVSEMGQATVDEQMTTWRTVIGPIFEGVWPLDVNLQTSASTFGLIQLLRATGSAFPLAADIVIPFIRPDERTGHSSVFSLTDAPESLFTSAPAKMLELATAVVGDAADGSVYGLIQVLDRIRTVDPALAETQGFKRLANRAAMT